MYGRIQFMCALFAAVAVAGACTVTRDQPNLVGQDIRVTLIHTSDIHSRLFPYYFVPNRFDSDLGLLPVNAPFGGAARMATIVNKERARANRSLWLDSGDCFQGAPVFNMFEGSVEMRTLSLMGLDAAVIGNHEFDRGVTNLFQQADNWAQYPLLAANYAFDDPTNPQERSLGDIVAPYEIFDLNGVRIGVIGMGNWSSMTGIFDGGNSLGLRPLDDAQVVKDYVRLLRPSVDVVLLLSHLGLTEDQDLAGSDYAGEPTTEKLPLAGVDVIFGGHLHIVLNPPKILPNDDLGHKTVVVHSGAFAKFVGRFDMVVHIGEDNSDPTKRSEITAFSYKTIPIDSTIDPDPKVAELLLPYSLELNEEINLDGVFAYVNNPGVSKIVRNDPSGGDSQLGSMTARSMQVRTGVEADFALTNSLGIRADFEQGPLTIEQMFNVFPFENSITVMYLSGTEVQEMLDFVARKSAGRGCRTQAQVAGIWFDMVCSGDCPGDATACAKNVYLGENCRGGDSGGPIDPSMCAPLEETGLYKVAVNDYIAAGGSGFDVLERNTSKQNTGVSLRDALIDYLRGQPTCADDVIDQTSADNETVVDRWGHIACLDQTTEPHDGRIRPVFE